MSTRKLALSRELLPELSADELVRLAGGTGLECILDTWGCMTVETGIECLSLDCMS